MSVKDAVIRTFPLDRCLEDPSLIGEFLSIRCNQAIENAGAFHIRPVASPSVAKDADSFSCDLTTDRLPLKVVYADIKDADEWFARLMVAAKCAENLIGVHDAVRSRCRATARAALRG